MFNKLKNRKGFTLMEMLIVVAIIAILVAIAIPTFNAAMAKSRAGTDLANIRSGYAAALVRGMTEAVDKTDGNTYVLQKDGSVRAAGDTGDEDNYACAGKSDNVADGSNIGGKFDVPDEVTWAKGNKITYVVKMNAEGVAEVDSITVE